MKWVLIVSFIELQASSINFHRFENLHGCYEAAHHFNTLYDENAPASNLQKYIKAICIEDKDRGSEIPAGFVVDDE